MIENLARKLALRDTVTARELEVLRQAIAHVEDHPAEAQLVREGEHQDSSRILLSGWAARQKRVHYNGRQISEFHLGGDFIDLHSFLLKRLDHSLVALTPCRVAVVPHAALVYITEAEPHLTRLLWLTTMLDAAAHRQWLAAMGRMPALAQTAHILCELYLRLEAVQLAEGMRYHLPLRQQQLADACGMTPVHMNRMLQQLRSDGLLDWQRGEVTIHDWPRLSALANFDPLYLNLWNEPR